MCKQNVKYDGVGFKSEFFSSPSLENEFVVLLSIYTCPVLSIKKSSWKKKKLRSLGKSIQK